MLRSCLSKLRRSGNFYRFSTECKLTKVEYNGGIKKITMCDSKSRNSLSLVMMQNLICNINKDQDSKDLRIIIVSAEGPVFSAGHNFKELTPDAGKSQHEKVFKLATQLMHSIIDCPVPVIARINGLAAAAGCQLVAQCDMSVCTETSIFSTPGVNFGIFCSTPGIPLVRKVLQSTVSKMLLTGLPITAAEAKASGLVTSVCPPEKLDEEIKILTDAVLAKSRSVVALGKRFFYKQMETDIRRAYDLGAIEMVRNLDMADGQEGVRSFVEKRNAKWTHGDN